MKRLRTNINRINLKKSQLGNEEAARTASQEGEVHIPEKDNHTRINSLKKQ